MSETTLGADLVVQSSAACRLPFVNRVGHFWFRRPLFCAPTEKQLPTNRTTSSGDENAIQLLCSLPVCRLRHMSDRSDRYTADFHLNISSLFGRNYRLLDSKTAAGIGKIEFHEKLDKTPNDNVGRLSANFNEI
jgi:hypothetical protein